MLWQHNGGVLNVDGGGGGGGGGGEDPNKDKCKTAPCAPGQGMCIRNALTQKWGCVCQKGWRGVTCSEAIPDCKSVHTDCQKPADLDCASGVYSIQLPGEAPQKMYCWIDGNVGWTLVWR